MGVNAARGLEAVHLRQLQIEHDGVVTFTGGEQVERFFKACAQLERMPLEVEHASLDLREVEDVVDDVQQPIGGAADGFDEVALLVGQLRVHQQRSHADDGVHRRADLVAGVGEELRLRARGFLKLLVQRDERRLAVHELLLALAQRAVGLIALNCALVGLRVIADARDELDLVGQLDEVIVRASGEGRPAP